MSRNSKQFLIHGEPWPSWRNFAYRPRSPRLVDIPSTSLHHLFFWARNAIYYSLKALGIRIGERVLVPAYICAAAIDPIEAFGAKVSYYEIGRNCVPDFSDLEAKIDDHTKAILAVHYFGFPCGIRQIRKICDQRRLYLIEDCAHVLSGEDGGKSLGTFGDVSVFSWRKFLPLFDGAELVLNLREREFSVEWQAERFLFTLRVAKNLLERALPETLASALGALRISRFSFSEPAPLASPGMRADRLLHVNANDSSFDDTMLNVPMSRLSRFLLEHCALESIVAKRRANYLYLRDQIIDSKRIRPLFEDLPEGVCPWVFPAFFDGMPNAHFAMRKLGIPAVSWGGVRHSGISPTQFPSAHFLYENLCFLPIHQDLHRSDLDLIAKIARIVQESWQSSVRLCPASH